MADLDTGSFLLGVIVGIIIVMLLLENASGASNRLRESAPRLNSYEVIRDDRGRIESVQVVEGLPG